MRKPPACIANCRVTGINPLMRTLIRWDERSIVSRRESGAERRRRGGARRCMYTSCEGGAGGASRGTCTWELPRRVELQLQQPFTYLISPSCQSNLVSLALLPHQYQIQFLAQSKFVALRRWIAMAYSPSPHAMGVPGASDDIVRSGWPLKYAEKLISCGASAYCTKRSFAILY